MKSLILAAAITAFLCGAAAAETTSATLVDIPYNSSVAVAFGAELHDIAAVEITMTSNIGPVYVCWEEWDGSFQSYPCGNVTYFWFGDAMMWVNGLGEIDHQSWSSWYQISALPDLVPVTDWSFLNSGTASFQLRCRTDGCYANPVYGVGYCGPYEYQVDEIVFNVTSNVVASTPVSWGSVKSAYR